MKQIKKLLITTFIALAIAMVCPSVIPNAGITNVEAAVKISKKKVTLIKGQTVKLKITGSSKKVKWSSSKKSVATVSSKGKVTAKKKGTATITAKVGKKKYTCKVKVKSAANPPEISKAEFNAIQFGMTYEEVVAIIGSYGELLAESGEKGTSYYTTIYMWEGEGSLGANANVMFQDNKVISKAQYGLK